MNRAKRIKSVIMICATIFASIESLPVIACIKENHNIMVKNEECINFTDNKNDYEYIDRKIEQEIECNTMGIEHKEIEQFLNEKGIFDEEMNLHLSQENLTEMEKAGLKNLTVMSAYYAVDDTCTEEEYAYSEGTNNVIDASNMIQLNDEEVDKYLSEEYFQNKTDLNSSIEKKIEKRNQNIQEKSFKNTIMQAIGIEPKEAFAESVGGYSYTMLKKTVIAYKVTDDYARVRVWFDWTRMPENRNLDTIAIRLDYGQYERNAPNDYGKITARHEYYNLVKTGPVGCKGSKIKISSKMKSVAADFLQDEEYHASSVVIKAAVKLEENESKLLSNGNVHSEEISGESVYFDFYVRFTTPNKNYLEITPIYVHVKKKADVFKLAKATIDLAKGNFVNVAYYLANSKKVNVEYDYSGVDRIFEMIVNFK